MSKTKHKSCFQDIWLENAEFKSWLEKLSDVSDINKARGKICAKEIYIDYIGTNGV